MALSDLTDPEAVLAAIAEFRNRGREDFLRHYGFGKAQRYFLLNNGEAFDSKAIAGAAHGHQHGVPLRPKDFSAGDNSVGKILTALGFKVGSFPNRDWSTAVGEIVTRSQMKNLYGGALYGGIEPSTTSPNILLYTDPTRGEVNGYNYDGWDPDQPSAFFYAGKGRVRDQTLTDGNKAAAEHEKAERTLRLFEAVKEPRRVGGKRHRYVGAFRIDPDNPYEYKPAPDKNGHDRQVIVFRLLSESSPSAPAPTGHVTVQFVPSENNTQHEHEVLPRTGTIARRAEAKLVEKFESFLKDQGNEVGRAAIAVPDDGTRLVTDTWDDTDKVLYEAKSGADRTSVRLAIGQIMDYLRFVPNVSGRLLLPERPSDDLVHLIGTARLGFAYPDGPTWTIVESPKADPYPHVVERLAIS